MENKIENGDVKIRLLDAGEELFADYGFEGTSARQLTQKAKCNLAAINYYFGGKFELYSEVISRKMKYLRERRIEIIDRVINERGDELTLKELITVFAESFVEPLTNEAGGRRFLKMCGWEMLNPKFSKDRFLDEMIKPVIQHMLGAFSKVCPSLPKEKSLLCIASIVAQLMHSIQLDNLFSGVKRQEFTSFTLQQRIEHIIEFSYEAVSGLCRNYAVQK
ncbi:MAG: CerR family C-terminal domain-containing protein [Planctomycetaceae bacterium]|nr:CerR family C-terminal domain-containing protein [Planctomycetaceae bacterium]